MCSIRNHAKNIRYGMRDINGKFTFSRVLIMEIKNHKRPSDISYDLLKLPTVYL